MRSKRSDDNRSSIRVPCVASEEGSIPTYTRLGDAGLDVRTIETFDLEPFERRCIHTGISIAIPDGFAGFVLPRSGLAAKSGISIVNAPGLIDANYRGEILVTLVNLDRSHTFHADKGDRIAQLVILSVPEIELVKTNKLPESNRGSDGFGSSGVS